MKRVVVALAMGLVLLVGADRVAAVAAEQGIATAVNQSQGLASRPTVTIHGFPLLTQAVRGRYDQVEVRAEDLTAPDGVTIDQLDVRLSDVRFSLVQLASQRVDTLPVGAAVATGTVSFDSLNAAAARQNAVPGLSVTFAEGADGRVAVRGSYQFLGLAVDLDGEAELLTRGDSLVVRPVAATLDLPVVVRERLLGLIGDSYTLPALPFGFRPGTVRVGPAGVTVEATARDVVLAAV